MKIFNIEKLRAALEMLNEQLELRQHPPVEQDVSEGFRFILKEMLRESGWKDVSSRI